MTSPTSKDGTNYKKKISNVVHTRLPRPGQDGNPQIQQQSLRQRLSSSDSDAWAKPVNFRVEISSSATNAKVSFMWAFMETEVFINIVCLHNAGP